MTGKRFFRTGLTALLAMLMFVSLALGLAACKQEEPAVAGEEKGTYYCETDAAEWLITLGDGASATADFGSGQKEGTYTLNGEALSLSFGEEESITAQYGGNTISLPYGGEEKLFYKKVNFTVTFETNGGTEVESVTVMNGKTVTQPDDPARGKYRFLGWCKDEALNEAFDFETERITQNTAIYAKWEYIPQSNTLTYDQTEGETETAAVTVTEGKEYTLEVPAVAAEYDFVGWFTEEGVQLTDSAGKSLAAWELSFGDLTVYARVQLKLTYERAEDGVTYAVSGSTATAHLTRLEIPAYYNGALVTEIKNFDGYENVETVSVPNSVTYISETAFPDSYKLKAYEIYAVEEVEDPAYRSEDGIVFSADGHTLVRYPVGKEDRSYTVPAAVTEIAASAFRDITYGDYRFPDFYGALEELTLPSNLKTVGERAFYQRGNMRVVQFNNDRSNVEWTVGDYAFYDTLLSQFPFEKNLVKIGAYAFSGGYTINHPTLPGDLVLYEKIESIGESAFASAGCFTSVKIPASLKSIGSAAFSSAGLQEVTFEAGSSLSAIPDSLFGYADITSIDLPDGIASIGDSVFYECRNLTEIAIPDTVTSIGDSAFYNCIKLPAIQLPAGLLSIGKEAFSSCRIITEMALPDGLTAIGDRAFLNMYALEKVNIPASVVNFGSGVFVGCSALDAGSGLTIDEGNTVIRLEDGVLYSADMDELLYYFANKEDASYVMPNTVKIIPEEAFCDHEYLTSVTLSENLEYIPSGAFDGSLITSIVIPASVTEIASSAFQSSELSSIEFAEGGKLSAIGEEAFYYTQLESVDLPAGIKTIGECAFGSCDQLLWARIPEGVTSLSGDCFIWCDLLETVYLPDSITYISDRALQDCPNLKSIRLPANLSRLGSEVFKGDTALAEITIDDSNGTYRSIDGNLYSKDGTALILYAVGKTADQFTLPDGVKKIEAYAFYQSTKEAYQNKNLTKVDLNEVTEIGNYAFGYSAGLSDIDLSGVVTLGNGAFANCGALKTVELDCLESMGDSAFFRCEELESVTFGDKLKKIPRQAFYFCSGLTSVELTHIESVGEYGFGYCGNLTEVTFGDSLQKLEADSFSSTKLARVTLPASLQSIDNWAFGSIRTLSEVIVDSQAAADSILAGSNKIVAYAATLRFKDTLTVSEEGLNSLGYTKGASENGYTVYTKNG